ncbi:MAG: hypothetical protein ABIP64_12240 [Burkholderiales bacterium]
MPKYFFHIRNGWDVVPDEEEMDFLSLNFAEVEGYASARDLSAAALREGHHLVAQKPMASGFLVSVRCVMA